jgi:hypothetical protein
LSVLPRSELPKKGFLFRIRHRGGATGLPTFIDETRKEHL